MQVFVAEPCGFCYGVKRAVDMARGECGKETHAATLGPLNPVSYTHLTLPPRRIR